MTTIYIREGTQLPERAGDDLYVTEQSLIRAAILWAAPSRTEAILDVGAGDGRWGRIAACYTAPQVVAGVELRDLPCPPAFTHWYSPQDFLTWEAPRQYSFIVSNPPYCIAEEAIRKSWDLLRPGGQMIFLLRLAFQAGVSRYKGLWNEIPPFEVGVLSRRPSFYGGGTNGTDYGLYHWVKEGDGSPFGRPGGWRVDLVYYERDKEERE